MNIGFVISNFSFGGGEKNQQFLMDEFYDKGNNIYIFTWECIQKPEKIKKYNIVDLKKKPNKVYQFIYELLTIPKLFKKFHIDIIIVFGLSESFVFSSYLTNIVSVTSLRVDPRFAKSQRLFKFRIPISYFFSDGIVFQTNKVQSFYSQRIKRKSVVISNPVCSEFTLKSDIRKKKKVISIGRLSQEKNFSMLINAFANTCPNDYTLHIYGDGPLEMTLKDEIKSLSMSEKIFIEGKTSSVVEVLSESEIFVLCSNFEGMPNALIEAMAMGLVCVSTNFPSGGAEELIDNYKNGILIPVGDQKKLELVLRELFMNKELCEILSENAILVKNSLQKDNIIEKWLSYLEMLRLSSS